MNTALNQVIASDAAKIEKLVALRTGAKRYANAQQVEVIRDRDYREIDAAIKHMNYVVELRAAVAAGEREQEELDDAIADLETFEFLEIQ